jgi:hypothetical protein
LKQKILKLRENEFEATNLEAQIEGIAGKREELAEDFMDAEKRSH